MNVSEDIIPLGEFKSKAAKVLKQLHETGRPIVVTQNGRPAAVLLTPEEFDRLSERDYAQVDRRATVRTSVVDDEALQAFEMNYKKR